MYKSQEKWGSFKKACKKQEKVGQFKKSLQKVGKNGDKNMYLMEKTHRLKVRKKWDSF